VARSRARYFFGRVNIISSTPNREALLPSGLQRSGVVLASRGQRWQFLQVTTLLNEDDVFYCGYLGKYKPDAEEEIALPEKQAIGDATVENRITAKARFFLHVDSHLIAYHPVGSLITRQSFCSNFAELLEEAFDRFFVQAEIQNVDDEKRVREAMAKFSRVSRIRIRLHPSNPSTRDLWRRTDERLRELDTSTYIEQYQAADEGSGLRVQEDEDVNAKLAMAEDGYGWAEVSGKLHGEEEIVSTDDHPVSTSVYGGDDDPNWALRQLIVKFREIIGRFHS
jgi:hypothetical protein